MTSAEFDAAVDRDVAALVARFTCQPYRAVVRDRAGFVQVVNVEAADVVEAAHRAGEFGDVRAIWATR